LAAPPAEVTVTWPWTGAPWSVSFQPISRARASMAGSLWAMSVKSPRQATPVELLL
jgi:hypothetical protein